MANYKNYILTYSVKNAHNDKINSIIHLKNGVFATSSSDKTIKIWNPFEQKPLGSLEEEEEITQMLPIGKVQ